MSAGLRWRALLELVDESWAEMSTAGREIFASWLAIPARCPKCGHVFERVGVAPVDLHTLLRHARRVWASSRRTTSQTLREIQETERQPSEPPPPPKREK